MTPHQRGVDAAITVREAAIEDLDEQLARLDGRSARAGERARLEAGRNQLVAARATDPARTEAA